jgi:hypothetical protein
MLERDIYISIIAGLVNLILSIIVPCALKNNKDFLPQVRIMLEQHRAALFTSSILVSVMVFLSLQAIPVIERDLIPNYLLNLSHLSNGRVGPSVMVPSVSPVGPGFGPGPVSGPGFGPGPVSGPVSSGLRF